MTWPVDYGHYPLDEVTSTLDVAREQGGIYPNPTWFTATRQTAARGRRGRSWVEPEGNFAATLSLPIADPNQAAFRSFIAALALHDAMSGLLPTDAGLSLKWPNDVLLNGGKVAGILLETLTHKNRIWGVAIGIGVNLAAAPPASSVEPDAVPPKALADAGVTVTPDVFLSHLAPAFDKWETTFIQSGFPVIRHAWLNHAARLGETITARTVRDTLTGTFETIDDTGQLVLRTAKGQVQVPAADVFF